MNLRTILAVTFATALTSYAHPGHDLMAHGAGHVATSVYHLWVLLSVAVASLGVAQIVRRPKARQLLRATGVTVLLAAGVMWGFGL